MKLSKKHPNGNEMILFHGTIEESVESIYKFGFNRSFCGKNGKNIKASSCIEKLVFFKRL